MNTRVSNNLRSDYSCLLCGNRSSCGRHILREMYFGLRETFEYLECASCGSLQIAEVPADLPRHYPDGYYSHLPKPAPMSVSPARDWVRRQRTAYTLYGRNPIGRLLHIIGRRDYVPLPLEWLRRTNVWPSSRILDVGCGSGDLLFTLRQCGFNHLVGIDPFRQHSEEHNGVALLKRHLFETAGVFDLVMSHHSLEHMSDPYDALRRMRDLTVPGGYILLRLPVMGRSWAIYGANWVELDAPRHLFVPSVSGVRALVDRVGHMEIVHTEFDSVAFEIAGSELYTRNIPLFPAELHGRSSVTERFDASTMQRFSAQVDVLNKEGTAGRAAFYVRVG